MKITNMMILALCLTASVTGSGASTNSIDKAKRMAEAYRKTGGALFIPARGFVALVNYQTRVPLAGVSKKFAETFSGFRLATRDFTSDTPFSFRELSNKNRELNSGASVLLVDDPNLPMSLVSIETRCGLVNVAALAVDEPSPAKLLRRTGKMVGRVAMMVCGGCESSAPTSAMQTVTNLEELDANEGIGDEAYVMMGVIKGMTKARVFPPQRVTYLQACRLGMAPAPTNDVQKAIWNKVHTLPKNPMKIEFDPKKGK